MGFHVSLGERILPHLFDLKKQLVSSLQHFVPCRLYNSPFSGDPDDISMNTFPRLTWNLKMGLGTLPETNMETQKGPYSPSKRGLYGFPC